MALTVAILDSAMDEIRTVQQSIPWEKLDLQMAGKATDAVSGEDLILRMKPDIVIADIQSDSGRMGELAQRIHTLSPDTYLIITTSCSESREIVRAIRYHVFDYLIKPVAPVEMTESLMRAAEEIHQKIRERNALYEAEKYRNKAQILSLLTNPSQRETGISEIVRGIRFDFSCYYILTVQPRDIRTMTENRLNLLDRIIAGTNCGWNSVLLYDTMVALISPGDEENWRSQCTQIVAKILKEFPQQVSIGISDLSGSSQAVRKAYHQARQAMWKAAVESPEKSRYRFYGAHPDISGHAAEDYDKRIEKLIESADLSDESARTAAKELIRLSGHQYSQMRAMIALYQLELKKKFPPPPGTSAEDTLYEVWFVTSEEEVTACLLNMCRALRQAREASQYSLITRTALQYIRIHAVDNVQLGEIADQLRISRNYLSSIIQKETGKPFRDHLQKARMEVAKTLLEDPRLKVDEVAQAVGYSNYVSFYNAFRKAEGMTPTEYRNRCLEGNTKTTVH